MKSIIKIVFSLCFSFGFNLSGYSQNVLLNGIDHIEFRNIQGSIHQDKLVIHDKRETQLFIFSLSGDLINQRKMEFNFPGNSIFDIDLKNDQIHLLLLSPYAISKQDLTLKSKEKTLISLQNEKLRVFDFGPSLFKSLSEGLYLSSTLEYEYLNLPRKGNSLTMIDINKNSNFSFSEFPESYEGKFFFFSGKQRFIWADEKSKKIYSYFNGTTYVEVFDYLGKNLARIEFPKQIFPLNLIDASAKIKLHRDFISLSKDIQNQLLNKWVVDFGMNLDGNFIFIFQKSDNSYVLKEVDKISKKVIKEENIGEFPIKSVGQSKGKFYYIYQMDNKYYLKSSR